MDSDVTISSSTADLMSLLQWPGVGPVKALRLMGTAESAELPLLERARLAFPDIGSEAQERAAAKALEIGSRCEELGIAVIGYEDEAYPRLLKLIGDPPPLLYVRGSPDALGLPALAVVGTRQVSSAGVRITQLIARFLARRSYSVVSGLALGTDAAAHRGALDAGGITVAVLAHGLHTIAPKTNEALAHEILDNGGALVAEHPPGAPPRPAEFVRRNRIQSGLSLGSIVVESAVKGGSMHQARFTREQGRTLITVLAASDETRADLNDAGARHLIDELGALPITSTSELARVLETLGTDLDDLPDPGGEQYEIGW